MRRLTAVTIGLATLLLALDFALTARWGWVVAIAAAGLLWLTESWHGRSWMSTVGLIFFTTVAAAGVILRLPPLWLLSSLVGALVAWDLDHFSHYLSGAADIRDEAELMKSHCRRLAAVTGLGWCLGAVALSVRFTFDFVPALALGLLIVIALSGAIRYMRRAGEGR